MYSLLLVGVLCASTLSLELKELLKELSWPLRVKLLSDVNPINPGPGYKTPPPLDAEDRPDSKQDIMPLNTALGTTAVLEKETTSQPTTDGRRVGIESLVLRQHLTTPKHDPLDNDDNDMRLKLFRLMYETVKDNDIKVKRAELIRDKYHNSSVFEIGYFVGDIVDKFDVIKDISATLKRFYHQWKPIEHINAYEQVANQAIEITHLIDLVSIIKRKDKGNL